ncbi:5363_t:CDS:1 [Entrophospora sp. SA101]|nr:6639_t:CDS:1 [Entrophospora candida]CAH1757553.1 3276_t:CDS:1 [Entrophospora sp. SA101]CAJ0746059.1 1163_t:CDS:1 [Entrophospora sp. SA101]CAJ0752264.1 9774_t:CDS:1 [Entrophospora sp. SA101]CAJ0758103.1 5363_t:CDS:1 [Entrophospora sp. SA101]
MLSASSNFDQQNRSQYSSLKDIFINNTNPNSPNPVDEEIPIGYVLDKLHQLGPRYLGDKSTAFAELHIEGIENKPFWVHKEYLVLQSTFFQQVFNTIKNSGECFTIKIPSPETFEPIFEYLYDGNADKWFDTITVDNCHQVWENVEFLGLSHEARAICLSFIQNNFE